MRQEFVLGRVGSLMGWDSERAAQEFAWLRLMSRMKYDDYQDFLAGMRFIESLANWLQQFPKEKRRHAYRLVRTKLIFFSAGEMRHLVELFYPETVEPRLMARISELTAVPRYEVWAHEEAGSLYDRLLRKSIFVELSDGARVDIFRRSNEGRISNEQVLTAPQINKSKWDDMLSKLRRDLQNDEERFAFVFLIDDFTASGTTLFRKEGDGWAGKLQRFWNDVSGVISTHFEPNWRLEVHHYVTTAQAWTAVRERQATKAAEAGSGGWFERVEFSYGMLLAPEIKMLPGDDADMTDLLETYYDSSIETEHIKKDARWGFNECGLPLVLEHNTPNNSLALLWADTVNHDGHSMRPLFRRRQRHV